MRRSRGFPYGVGLVKNRYIGCTFITPDQRSREREAGAVQVHLRISAPPFITPCYFGTDIPDSEHLIAHDRSPEEICALTGADSLGFLPLKVLHQIAPDAGCGFCDGCFTGNYPIRL